MVWLCSWAAGALNLATVEGTMDSFSYFSIREKVLFPFVEDEHGQNWRFQWDNASFHTSNYNKMFFADTYVGFLEWSTCSPDLNPTENVWGYLVNKVFDS